MLRIRPSTSLNTSRSLSRAPISARMHLDQAGDTRRVVKSKEEWKKVLSPEAYHITREKGTERPFTGKYLTHKGKGVYECVCCGNPLFPSDAKFESGTGWPSFTDTVSRVNVDTKEDHSYGMTRVEVVCTGCEAHLGHVFDDGPAPTGLRYCINSAALAFRSEEEEQE